MSFCALPSRREKGRKKEDAYVLGRPVGQRGPVPGHTVHIGISTCRTPDSHVDVQITASRAPGQETGTAAPEGKRQWQGGRRVLIAAPTAAGVDIHRIWPVTTAITITTIARIICFKTRHPEEHAPAEGLGPPGQVRPVRPPGPVGINEVEGPEPAPLLLPVGGLTQGLRLLRDHLVLEGAQGGGVDVRLPAVALGREPLELRARAPPAHVAAVQLIPALALRGGQRDGHGQAQEDAGVGVPEELALHSLPDGVLVGVHCCCFDDGGLCEVVDEDQNEVYPQVVVYEIGGPRRLVPSFVKYVKFQIVGDTAVWSLSRCCKILPRGPVNTVQGIDSGKREKEGEENKNKNSESKDVGFLKSVLLGFSVFLVLLFSPSFPTKTF